MTRAVVHLILREFARAIVVAALMTFGWWLADAIRGSRAVEIPLPVLFLVALIAILGYCWSRAVSP